MVLVISQRVPDIGHVSVTEQIVHPLFRRQPTNREERTQSIRGLAASVIAGEVGLSQLVKEVLKDLTHVFIINIPGNLSLEDKLFNRFID